MQKALFVFLLFIIIGFSLSAIGPVEKNPIKVAKLTEVARITDEEGNFAFKRPRSIKIAPDGSVFVAESKALFKFTPQGKFVRNFIKIGEGPGEVKNFANFFFVNDGIVTASYMPVKILLSGIEGNHIREFTLFKAQTFTLILNVINNKYYFNYSKLSARDLKSGINKNKNQIIYCDSQGTLHQTGIEFTTIDALIKQTTKDGRTLIAMDNVTRLLTAFDNRNIQLFAVHKTRYEIDRFDLNSHKLLNQIKLPYKPVPYTSKPAEDEFDAKIEKIKDRKFYNDIQAMKIYNGKLLVFTSTMDKESRALVDFYNIKGELEDKFFLKIPQVERPDDLRRKPMCFHKGFFWTTSMDEDDNPFIIKYKIDI